MKRTAQAGELLHQEVSLRQRNRVFPDTVRNEFAGYHHLLSASKLSVVQRIGAGLIGILVLPMGVLMTLSCLFLPRIAGEAVRSTWTGLAFIPLGLLDAAIGVAFTVSTSEC